MIAEWLWIAYGLNDVATLKQYNSQMGRFSDDEKTLAGAYGPRLEPQWQYLVDTLVKDYWTRQAVATIWTPNPKGSKDVPCTISLQFIARAGLLNCIVTMRSSDIWLGLPYDCSTFSLLQNCLAGVVGLNVGYLQFNLGSSHLYASDFEKAKAVLDDVSHYESIRSPRLPYFPERYTIGQPVAPLDFLKEPKKFSPWELDYPWNIYGGALNSDTWEKARLCLAAGQQG
jgi:thymidylate synthase